MNKQLYDRWQYESGLLAMTWIDKDDLTDINKIKPEWLTDKLNRDLRFKMQEFHKLGMEFDILSNRDFFGLEGIKRLMAGLNTFDNIVCNWGSWVKWFESDYIKREIEYIQKSGKETDKYRVLLEKLKDLQKPDRPINTGTMKETTKEALGDLADEMSGKAEKYSTGLRNLDEYLLSLRPKRFYVIAGKPGACKTNLGLSMMLHNIKNNVPVIYFSSEMGASKLTERMACMLLPITSTITYSRVMEGDIDQKEYSEIHSIMSKIYNYPGLFLETSRFSMSFIEDKIKLYEAKIIIIDFVQMFRIPETKKDNAASIHSEIASQLKELAMDNNIVVIGLSQLNKQGGTKESSSYEEKADAVIKLEVGDNELEIKHINAEITKNRYGDTGGIELMLYKKLLLFKRGY